MEKPNMGVLVVVSHLIITIVILFLYGYTLHTGSGDDTLKTILTVVIGYWFGAMGSDMLKKSQHAQTVQPVKVVEDTSKEKEGN